MNKETVDAIVNAIKPVAEKIGEGAAHLYQVYVRQVYVEGVVCLTVGLPISLAVLVASIYILKSGMKAYQEDGEGEIRVGVACLLLLISLVSIAAFASDGVMRLLNPEYYAIDRILSTVRGK
jgi:hypothetical protein